MINKRYILKALLLPLFTCLLFAGTAGCSNEGILPEGGEEPDNGGTTSFSIVMGRVVTDVPSDGNFDDYISSVRVLAFDDSGPKYNMLFTGSAGNDGKAWTIVGDGISIADENVSLEGGTYTFYFIANEGEHQLDGNGNLKDKLDGSLTEDELMQIIISYSKPSEDTPILMTAQKEWHIIAGSKNETDVKLERTCSVAKIKSIMKDEIDLLSGAKYQLIFKVPNTYSLFSTGTLSSKNDLEVSLTEDNPVCYFPEGQNVELFSAYVDINGRKYENISSGTTIFSVSRNEGLEINLILKEDDPVQITWNAVVVPWDNKEMNVPDFN